MATQAQASPPVSTISHRKYWIWGITIFTGGTAALAWYRWHQAQQGSVLHADSPRQLKSKPGKVELVDNDHDETAQAKESDQQPDGKTKTYIPDWSNIGDKIKDAVVPDWAQELPEYVSKLQEELSDEPGSLADQMWQEAHNPQIHPEIERDASVRVSDELCDEEQAFLRRRKERVRKGLSKYLDIPEDDIHPDDVPVIGMCGSGGGLRAMVAGSSSYLSAQEAGLFDCVTYTAGVSGSCWLQSLYHSTLTHQQFGHLLDHLRSRISVHIAFPPPVLKLVTHAPTHKYLLSGALEKWKGMESAEFGIVDVYGLLLAARLMVPKGELDVDPKNLKLSQQRRYIDDGQHPLPIYTAVRHEVPSEDKMKENNQDEDVRKESKKEAWFQWLEFTPYELWCEEFSAGIPTWSIGRTFDKGQSKRTNDGSYMPELRIPLLQGIWGSAFCATLSHYYKEIRPLVKGLTGFGGLDKLLEEHNDDLVKVHPVAPSQIPNYAKGMKELLPERCPDSVHEADEMQLMDAGMSNNLPIYPLLRPGREVDVLLAFDASADIKTDDWLRVADGYARQRGIKGWPVGTGWSDGDTAQSDQVGKDVDEAEQLEPKDTVRKLNEAKGPSSPNANESGKQGSETSSSDTAKKEDKEEGKPKEDKEEDKPSMTEQAKRNLGYCTVWVGTTEERTSTVEPPQSKQVEDDWGLMQPNAGIAVVYFPFMANPEVEGVDPEKSDFMSTWNFIYKPEDIDKVVALARANFKAGEEKTKTTIRAVYDRKKRLRLEREGHG